jgi:hypothetical protein
MGELQVRPRVCVADRPTLFAAAAWCMLQAVDGSARAPCMDAAVSRQLPTDCSKGSRLMFNFMRAVIETLQQKVKYMRAYERNYSNVELASLQC